MMAKESSSENLKRLLQTEKRLVDLEITLTEIKEKLKEFDVEKLQALDIETLSSLPQSIEDLEDLTMVENAGIIELKKMLEEMQAKVPQPAQPTQPEIHPEFESLKNNIEDLAKKKSDTDLKLQMIEKNIAELETKIKETTPSGLAEEVNSLRNEWGIVLGKLSTLEQIVSETSTTIPKLEASLAKFETFERASLLSKELETKMDQFRLIESETKRLTNKIEMMYDNLDKRLDKVREMERKFPTLMDSISKLEKEIDANRVLILERSKKEELNEMKNSLTQMVNRRFDEINKKVRIEELRKELEAFKASIENDVNSRFENLMKTFDTKALMDIQMDEMANKMVFLETRLSAIEKMMRESYSIQPVIIE